ncbi:Protein of unknown function [Thiothrix eikelboomii]|uniref:DUF3108 domain-containing protein n=1 Tax=Thiothrix eikelboomii TaxID=92487 RepID=A0A1T4VRD4_9GAMM|nr:DUF3108 domain-containing protein [Thiothrix eikelboomii]SKA67507.1 Protein of unknown function [Thiothrix eikelboomii]
MFKQRPVLVIAGALSFTSLPALAAPLAFQATYSVANSGLTVGETQTSLSYQAAGYTFQKITKANGVAALISGDSLTERSVGLKQGDKLQTQQYLYQHKSRRKAKQDQYQFTSATEIKGKLDQTAYTLKVPKNTIDPALIELRLMEDVAANRPLNYSITERGKLKTYQFQRLGKETITTPLGQYACEKVKMTRDNGERQTTLWLAPELDYVAAQIQHNEKGNITEAQLTHYQAKH